MKRVLTLIAAVAATMFVAGASIQAADTVQTPKPAAPTAFTFVRGKITSVQGDNLKVDTKMVTLDNQTVIVKAGQPSDKSALTVGASITARINKEGIAVRIEIHP